MALCSCHKDYQDVSSVLQSTYLNSSFYLSCQLLELWIIARKMGRWRPWLPPKLHTKAVNGCLFFCCLCKCPHMLFWGSRSTSFSVQYLISGWSYKTWLLWHFRKMIVCNRAIFKGEKKRSSCILIIPNLLGKGFSIFLKFMFCACTAPSTFKSTLKATQEGRQTSLHLQGELDHHQWSAEWPPSWFTIEQAGI